MRVSGCESLRFGEVQQRMMSKDEGLIRCSAAAHYLGVSEWSVRKMAHDGQLPYIQRTPRSPMLFDPVDLRKYVEGEKIRGGG